MKVKYKGRSNSSLTKGNDYAVTKTTNERFHIINDQGKEKYYNNKNINFEKIIDISSLPELEKVEVFADQFLKIHNIKNVFVEQNDGQEIIITHFMFEFYKHCKLELDKINK
jgi:hypothetical protein